MTALWLPYQVADLGAATAFYIGRLGLSIVDSWEGGVVLDAGAAFVELATGDESAPVPLAFQQDSDATVDALSRQSFDLLVPPHRYPRGHYGFEVRGPAGARVMIWSER